VQQLYCILYTYLKLFLLTAPLSVPLSVSGERSPVLQFSAKELYPPTLVLKLLQLLASELRRELLLPLPAVALLLRAP
jgi:hypothetical protein